MRKAKTTVAVLAVALAVLAVFACRRAAAAREVHQAVKQRAPDATRFEPLEWVNPNRVKVRATAFDPGGSRTDTFLVEWQVDRWVVIRVNDTHWKCRG